MALADLLVKINGDIAGLKTSLNDANTALSAFGKKQEEAAKTAALAVERQANSLEAKLKSFGNSAQALGQRLTVAITLPMVGVGAAALKVAGDLEQANIAFETMLGSGQAARKFLEELKAFALKTPFSFMDLTDASKRLIALGFNAKEVIPTLEAVGAAAAALGKGKDGIDRITLAFGQMLAKGRVQAEEMRQLAEAGIPAWDILAKKLGVDIPTAMKMVEARTVDSRVAIDALTENMRTRFGPAFDKFAQSWQGMLEKMKEQAQFAAADIGKILMPVAKSLVDEIIIPAIGKVKDLASAFAELNPQIQKFTIGVAGVAAVTPLLLWGLGSTITNAIVVAGAISKIAAVLSAIPAGLGLLGLAFGIVTAAVLATVSAIGQLEAKWKNIFGEKGTVPVTKSKTLLEPWSKAEGAEVSSNLGIVLAKPSSGAVASAGISAEAEKKAWQEAADAYKRSRLAFDERSAQASILANNVQEAWRWQQMLNAEFEAFGVEVPAISSHIEDLRKVWEPTFSKAPTQIDEISDAFKTLGITSADEYQRIADASTAAYKTIEESGIGTMEEVTRAFLKSERDQIRAAEAKGIAVSDSWKKMLDSIEADLNKTTSVSVKTTQQVESGLKKLSQQVSTVLTDLSKDLADLVFEGGKLKDVLVGVAESFGKALLRMAIEAQLQRILGLFKDLIGQGGVLGKVLGVIFGGGSSAAGGAASTVAGSAGSAAGSAGSAAASGALGWVGAIGSVGSMVSGIISNFQNARQETSLNAIELNTRKTAIYLGEATGTGGLSAQMWRLLEDVEYGTFVKVLEQIRDKVVAGAGGAVTININGAQDSKKVAEEVMNALRMRSTSAAYA